MEKKAIRYGALLAVIAFLGTMLCIYLSSRKSHSEFYHDDERVIRVLTYESAEFDHEFKLATRAIEKRIFGTWRAEDFIGWSTRTKVQGEALLGETISINKDEAVKYDRHYSTPILYYYTLPVAEMAEDSLLLFHKSDDIEFKDNSCIVVRFNTLFPDKEGGLRWGGTFILIDDMLLFEDQSSYYKLTKIEDK